jgi:translation initiation factor 1
MGLVYGQFRTRILNANSVSRAFLLQQKHILRDNPKLMSSRIVYSTGLGSLCPNCRHPVRECVCPKGVPGAAKPAAVRVARETQGRAGKGVTTITGLPLSLSDIEALATKLKKRCGSGGTVRAGIIEIQGDHRDVIVGELIKMGWPAKRSGG